MNARELIEKISGGVWPYEAKETILRALELLAAVDESGDEIVRMCNAASYDERLSDGMLYRKAAARIVALEQELASGKAHAEAMAVVLERLGWVDPQGNSLKAYRAAHPKEGT